MVKQLKINFKSIKVPVLLLVIIFLNSCVSSNNVVPNGFISKRKYNKGLHIERDNVSLKNNKSIKTSLSTLSIDKPEKIKVTKHENIVSLDSEIDTLITEVGIVSVSNKMLNNKVSKLVIIDSCDLILMKNGDEVQAKVLEIGPDVIKYKLCDNLKGPIFTVSSSDVFKIKYPNGKSTLISEIEDSSSKNNTNQNVKDTASVVSILGISFGIAGLFIFGIIFGIVAISFGIAGLIIVNRKPKKEQSRKSRNLSIWSIIVGLVDFLGILLFFIFF